jgi:Lrp/AsnC family transcriptional regulator, cysteine-sensing transcriptional activator
MLPVGFAYGSGVFGKDALQVHTRILRMAPGYAVAKLWYKAPCSRNNIAVPPLYSKQSFVDKLDRKILELLQQDGALTAAEVADRVGLSKAPCWRRIKKLQEEGVIKQTVSLLDARALNVGTTVFVMLKTAKHNQAWFDKFVAAVRDIPEVTEIHRMSGDVDYLMRIVVPDIDAYDVVYKRLISAVEFLDVSASFALETIKYTTALPLGYVQLD